MLIKIGELILTASIFLFAGELNFVASVNKTEVGQDEPLMLTVTVQGENIGQVPAPQLPDLPDFAIGGRSSSQSTNIQFINGKVQQQQKISYVYTLYPSKIGELTIGSCSLLFEGNTYATQPITVNVIKGTTKPSTTSPSSPAPSEPGIAIDENLKLAAVVNRKSVYVGEQVTIEFALYNRLNISDVNLAQMPSFNGFWVEPIFDAKRLEFQRRSVQGELYNVAVIKKCALFPMTDGRLKINPMEMDIAVLQPSRDFFDFFGRAKNVRIKSNAIDIEVKPLPTAGRSDVFTGGIGQFTIEASLDRKTSEAAEPINLTVRVSGTGNVKLIEKPLISAIPNVKILDPEIKDNITAQGDRIRGYKEFRYPLIPQIDGEHVVPVIKIAYFNPEDKKYHMLMTEELKFTAIQTATATEEVRAEGLKVLGTDIRYIKANAMNLRTQKQSADPWLAFLYVISLVVVAISTSYRRHQTRLLTDRAYARKLRASRTIKKSLKQAEAYLKRKDEKELLNLLSRILLSYIGDRYNLDTSAFTKEQLIEDLKKKKVDGAILAKLSNVLEQCDLIRFSPGIQCDNPQELYENTKEILNKL